MAEFKSYSLRDAKIAKLLTDPSGGSATYATSVDVPGIQSIGLRPNITSNDLKGDDKILDVETKLDSVEWSMTHALLSFDVMEILDGSTKATVTANVTKNTVTGTATFAGKITTAVTTAANVVGNRYRLEVTVVGAAGTGAYKITRMSDNSVVVASRLTAAGAQTDFAGWTFTVPDTTGCVVGDQVDLIVESNGEKLTALGASTPNYFKLEAQVNKTGGGDYHLTLFKCQATGGVEIEHSQDNYAVVSASGRAIPRFSDDKIREFKKNDTETAIV